MAQLKRRKNGFWQEFYKHLMTGISYMIPVLIMGGLIGAFSGIALGAVQWFPESAIWAWPLVKNLPSYILGIAIGSIIIAVCNVLYRNKLIKDGKLEIDEY